MTFDPKKWYFKTHVFFVAFLCIGPFALPLAWINPRFSIAKKIIITVIVFVISFYMAILLNKSIQAIVSYYQQLSKMYQ